MDKKVIFSMLTAMVISFGLFNSTVNNSDTLPDYNLTQLGAAGVYYGCETESPALIVLGGISIGTGFGIGVALVSGGLANVWNPVGWGCVAAGLIL